LNRIALVLAGFSAGYFDRLATAQNILLSVYHDFHHMHELSNPREKRENKENKGSGLSF
jgi:hypothetical protein